MDPFEARLEILIVALVVSGMMTGAGLYEQSVLDTAWPARPDLVRPSEGGVNRKHFWVPGNVVAIAALLAAAGAAWPIPKARYAVLAALGLFALINLVTVSYFGPAVLRVERVAPPRDDPASSAWVQRSRWRTPLALAVNAAMALALLYFWRGV
jgi:hypothetical protein